MRKKNVEKKNAKKNVEKKSEKKCRIKSAAPDVNDRCWPDPRVGERARGDTESFVLCFEKIKDTCLSEPVTERPPGLCPSWTDLFVPAGNVSPRTHTHRRQINNNKINQSSLESITLRRPPVFSEPKEKSKENSTKLKVKLKKKTDRTVSYETQ